MKNLSDSAKKSQKERLQGDAIAGLVVAVASVPSGMATAAVAGVNPVFGLYASVVAPPVGSLLARSQLMQISTTGASALTAGQAIASYSADERGEALFLLVAIAGIFLVLFGLLNAGRLVDYISFPVMTGFLSGVATALVFDQTAQLVGYSPGADTTLGQFLELWFHIRDFSGQSVLIGVFALAIIIGFQKTKWSSVATLIGLVVPTILVVLWNPGDVELVSDVATIPRGFPPLGLPDITLISPGLLISGLSLAIVIAIQGAGISQTYKNPDGSLPNPSRDMFAQGAGNIAGSFVSGMPTGGSVGQTALNVSAGARSRLAGVFHGVFMLVIILLVPRLVSLVPMPVLASIMIVAGLAAIGYKSIAMIWRMGGTSRVVLLVTFFSTLVMSIPSAVALGVVTDVVLYVYSSATDVTLYSLVPQENGEIHALERPETLEDLSITVLDVSGSLFFAAANTFKEKLPKVDGAHRPVVIIQLRGNNQIGATVIDVFNDYADELAAAGGLLILNGMDEQSNVKLKEAREKEGDDDVTLFPATRVMGQSTHDAVAAANDFLRPYRDDGEDTLRWPSFGIDRAPVE